MGSSPSSSSLSAPGSNPRSLPRPRDLDKSISGILSQASQKEGDYYNPTNCNNLGSSEQQEEQFAGPFKMTAAATTAVSSSTPFQLPPSNSNGATRGKRKLLSSPPAKTSKRSRQKQMFDSREQQNENVQNKTATILIDGKDNSSIVPISSNVLVVVTDPVSSSRVPEQSLVIQPQPHLIQQQQQPLIQQQPFIQQQQPLIQQQQPLIQQQQQPLTQQQQQPLLIQQQSQVPNPGPHQIIKSVALKPADKSLFLPLSKRKEPVPATTVPDSPDVQGLSAEKQTGVGDQPSASVESSRTHTKGKETPKLGFQNKAPGPDLFFQCAPPMKSKDNQQTAPRPNNQNVLRLPDVPKTGAEYQPPSSKGTDVTPNVEWRFRFQDQAPDPGLFLECAKTSIFSKQESLPSSGSQKLPGHHKSKRSSKQKSPPNSSAAMFPTYNPSKQIHPAILPGYPNNPTPKQKKKASTQPNTVSKERFKVYEQQLVGIAKKFVNLLSLRALKLMDMEKLQKTLVLMKRLLARKKADLMQWREDEDLTVNDISLMLIKKQAKKLKVKWYQLRILEVNINEIKAVIRERLKGKKNGSIEVIDIDLPDQESHETAEEIREKHKMDLIIGEVESMVGLNDAHMKVSNGKDDSIGNTDIPGTLAEPRAIKEDQMNVSKIVNTIGHGKQLDADEGTCKGSKIKKVNSEGIADIDTAESQATNNPENAVMSLIVKQAQSNEKTEFIQDGKSDAEEKKSVDTGEAIGMKKSKANENENENEEDEAVAKGDKSLTNTNEIKKGPDEQSNENTTYIDTQEKEYLANLKATMEDHVNKVGTVEKVDIRVKQDEQKLDCSESNSNNELQQLVDAKSKSAAKDCKTFTEMEDANRRSDKEVMKSQEKKTESKEERIENEIEVTQGIKGKVIMATEDKKADTETKVIEQDEQQKCSNTSKEAHSALGEVMIEKESQNACISDMGKKEPQKLESGDIKMKNANDSLLKKVKRSTIVKSSREMKSMAADELISYQFRLNNLIEKKRKEISDWNVFSLPENVEFIKLEIKKNKAKLCKVEIFEKTLALLHKEIDSRDLIEIRSDYSDDYETDPSLSGNDSDDIDISIDNSDCLVQEEANNELTHAKETCSNVETRPINVLDLASNPLVIPIKKTTFSKTEAVLSEKEEVEDKLILAKINDFKKNVKGTEMKQAVISLRDISSDKQMNGKKLCDTQEATVDTQGLAGNVQGHPEDTGAEITKTEPFHRNPKNWEPVYYGRRYDVHKMLERKVVSWFLSFFPQTLDKRLMAYPLPYSLKKRDSRDIYCSCCDERFANLKSFLRHMETVHNKPIVVCKECHSFKMPHNHKLCPTLQGTAQDIPWHKLTVKYL